MNYKFHNTSSDQLRTYIDTTLKLAEIHKEGVVTQEQIVVELTQELIMRGLQPVYEYTTESQWE